MLFLSHGVLGLCSALLLLLVDIQMMCQVILLLRRCSVTFREEKAQANIRMFLSNENGIFTSEPEKNNGQRGLYVSKVTLGKVHAGKLLSQVTCWLGTMVS